VTLAAPTSIGAPPIRAATAPSATRALLEEAHIKVSSLVSDLLGISARRMLQALADGETDPAALATPRPRACVPRPSSCATPSRRVRRCIRFTVGC
jgi:hypothetical protein